MTNARKLAYSAGGILALAGGTIGVFGVGITACRFGLDYSRWPSLFAAAIMWGYILFVGIRCLRAIAGRSLQSRIGWGKIIIGMVIILVTIDLQLRPEERTHKPLNAAQNVGAAFAQACFIIGGIFLIVSGFRPKAVSVSGQASPHHAVILR